MNGKRFSEDKARRNGFYLALAVCLVAVGIAAWSTYDAVHGYLKTESDAQSAQLTEEQEQDVRDSQEESSAPAGAAVDDDPESPHSTSSAQQTAGGVTLKPKQETPKETSSLPSQAPEESSSPEEPEDPPIPATAPLYEISGEMSAPLSSTDAQKAYSAGAPVYSETMRDWRIHKGLDIAAQANEAVNACANGQVKETYTDAMLGNVVVIEHGDYEFSYCGLGEEFQVTQGDIVSKGQQIGVITAVPSESADAPHLHLEVRRDGVCLDPQSVLDGKE